MGSPKPMLRLGSSSVVERVIAAARLLGAPVVLIAAPPSLSEASGPQHTRSLDDFLATLDLPIYRDLEPDRGPLGGLHAAFEQTGSAQILLLACDLPFVTTPFLRFLLSHGPLTCDALVPQSAAGHEPLCALYSISCRASLARTLRGPNLSIRRFIDGLDADVLRPSEYEHLDPEGLVFTNLNTPQEYARARDLIAQRDGLTAPPD